MGTGAGGARILLDGRRASPAGAAFAGASTIDAFDAHDGHPLTKGHAGVAVLPALFAVADAEGGGDGRDLLVALVLGYEVAIRAGIALHASVPDYHTSGAWNALGCAAVAARLLGLSADATRHALGIAEYHGPRSQMMRCIDHPTMVKDGSGWGAFAGVTRGLSRRRRVHRRAGDHDRGRRGGGAVVGSRPALAHPRALFQAAAGLPLGAAGDRGRAGADRAGADRRRAPRSRAHQVGRGRDIRRRSAPRHEAAGNDRGGAIRARLPARRRARVGTSRSRGHRRRGPAR